VGQQLHCEARQELHAREALLGQPCQGALARSLLEEAPSAVTFTMAQVCNGPALGPPETPPASPTEIRPSFPQTLFIDSCKIPSSARQGSLFPVYEPDPNPELWFRSLAQPRFLGI